MDSPADLVVVAHFRNDTSKDLLLFLELTCEEVILSPGHEIDLLARPIEGLRPITIVDEEDGWVVYPHLLVNTDWHIRYKGQIVRADYPTRIADLDNQPSLVASLKDIVQKMRS